MWVLERGHSNSMGPDPRTPETELGAFLRRLYERAGLNKSTFAEAIGVKWSTVHSWALPAKASVPDGGTVARIVKHLTLSPDEQAKLNELVSAQEQLRNARPRPPRPSRKVEYEPRYHNAGLALRQLHEEGIQIPPDVAEDVVEGVRLASDEDPPVRFWRASFQQQLKLRTTYRDATLEQIRTHLGGVAVPEEDVARPRRGKR